MPLGARPQTAAEGRLAGDVRRAAPSLWGKGKFCFGEPWDKDLLRNKRELGGQGRQFLQLRVVSVQEAWLCLKASPDAERNEATSSLCWAALELKTITAAKQNQLS